MDRIHDTSLRKLLWDYGANERRGLIVGIRSRLLFLLANGISDICFLKLLRHGNSALSESLRRSFRASGAIVENNAR